MNTELDKSNFRQMIISAPDQFAEGMRIADGVRIEGDFDKIMISGMGGSALPGNLFRIYLNDLFKRGDKKPLAVFQNRFYGLPPEAHDRCLNFICSYSGNTEETIASFEEALAAGLPCIGLSAGGKVEAMCKEHDIPHVKLPLPTPEFQPRAGTGYFFGVLFQILVNQGLIPSIASAELADCAASLKQSFGDIEERGKVLAKKLAGKTPIIYASTKYKSVAMVWKIKINENAKTPAFWNFFPELNHNEMVGWTLPQGKFVVIMLRDPEDHPRNLKRFEITAGLLREKGVDVELIDMAGEDVFSKIFMSIALGDFASYYLALEYGQDPTPVAMVEELKHLLVA
jgi:glucose/mannose-6-phosphate isomerase